MFDINIKALIVPENRKLSVKIPEKNLFRYEYIHYKCTHLLKMCLILCEYMQFLFIFISFYYIFWQLSQYSWKYYE